MNFIKPIGKYASMLTVSLLVGTGAVSALADDAGYHAEQLERIQAQTDNLPLAEWGSANLDTTPTRDRHVATSTRAQTTRARADQNPTPSEELWAHFQAYANSGM